MRSQIRKQVRRGRRIVRGRKKVRGTPERPRLAVTRSLRHIQAQIIDDDTGRTLCSASTRSKSFAAGGAYGGNAKAAAAVGQMIGEMAKSKGIEQVAFDRRGSRYHGRVKALADAARAAGLKF
ncbi:MAG: 50S ribosomal protein L18 [Phycisphaerae bacterium]|nr:50S ribosomal protein L18 [Phycisphaerae bacterium]